MSLMSVVMGPVLAIVFIALAALDMQPWAYAVYAAVAALMLIVLHRENVERLLAGTEPRLGQGGQERRAPPG